MPTNYLNITIAGQPLDVGSVEDFPIAINYSLEDPEDFQKKESATSFNVKFPATLQNRKVANSYHDASTEDLTTGEQYKSHQPAIIEADGNELLVGKAFLVNATHSAVPEDYEYNFYGGNGDWIVDLKEKTLYDFLSGFSFTFTKEAIVTSWAFDGMDELLPYVFAPVRYRGLMDTEAGKDDNVSISYMRPSISKYWLLYWGFKSLGYRIQSNFFDTPYFRRQVMPWTWGNFLDSGGTKLDVHNFLAKSTIGKFINSDYKDFLDLNVSDETSLGTFDNNGEYSYTAPEMRWQYNAPYFGNLDAHLSITISTSGNIVGSNSYFDYYIIWYYNGVEYARETILAISGRNLSRGDYDDFKTFFTNHIVLPGDTISAKLFLEVHEGKGIGARVNFHSKVEEFKRDYFRIPIGGTVAFANYTGFKNFKFLDFLSGIVDEFNLSIQTDAINKVVYIEPTHGYNVDGTLQPGYFVDDYIDWQWKKDLSKQWKMNLFSDYEKEVIFKYRDDSNDGVLKVVQDRNQNTLAAGKYLFPDRFKAGKREHENRFFAPVMHFDAEQFKSITGIAPQMVCIIPENISNTSNSEADNTFTPKSCYYKGLVTGAGGWKFDGEEYTDYPYLFSVNYKAGGESDPVLSYSDERIGTAVAKGLMKQFFSQRLAIMRNGQFYEAYMRLKDVDVNRLHREYKIIDGLRWELVQINNYLPLKSDSTACVLRKWVPVQEVDYTNSFPSNDSVLNSDATLAGNDIKYAQLKCLLTDILK
jgi:hypothetical protein